MESRRIYIADKEELVIRGMKALFAEEGMKVESVGASTKEEWVIAEVETCHPDILFIDERMMFDQFVPLHVMLSLKYPEIQVALMTMNMDSFYIKRNYTEFVIAKSVLNQDSLKGLLELMDKCSLDKETEAGTEIKQAVFLPELNYERGMLLCIRQERLGRDISRQVMLRQMIFQHIQTEESAVFLMTDEGEQMIFLVNYKNKEKKQMKSKINRLIQVFREELEGVEGYCQGDFSAARMDGEMIRRFSQEAARCFFYQRPLPKAGQKEETEEFDFGYFQELLRIGNVETAVNILSLYIKKAAHAMVLPTFLLSAVNVALMFCMNHLGEKTDNSQIPCFSLSSCPHYQEFKEAYQKAVIQIKRMAGDYSPEMPETKAKPILDYIQMNYMMPLNLREIAQKFNYNYHYLSVYFSRYVKKTFTEYLNDIRIKQACVLLQRADTPIAVISDQIGYSNHSYFTRVFKKRMGISPREYQMKQQVQRES